jgi:hypothetical protein
MFANYTGGNTTGGNPNEQETERRPTRTKIAKKKRREEKERRRAQKEMRKQAMSPDEKAAMDLQKRITIEQRRNAGIANRAAADARQRKQEQEEREIVRKQREEESRPGVVRAMLQKKLGGDNGHLIDLIMHRVRADDERRRETATLRRELDGIVQAHNVYTWMLDFATTKVYEPRVPVRSIQQGVACFELSERQLSLTVLPPHASELCRSRVSVPQLLFACKLGEEGATVDALVGLVQPMESKTCPFGDMKRRELLLCMQTVGQYEIPGTTTPTTGSP